MVSQLHQQVSRRDGSSVEMSRVLRSVETLIVTEN